MVKYWFLINITNVSVDVKTPLEFLFVVCFSGLNVLPVKLSVLRFFIYISAGGVVLNRKWQSTGVCCWCLCLPSRLCHKVLILLLTTAGGERHKPQQEAVMLYAILFRFCRAKALAGIAGGMVAWGPILLKVELDSSLTGPYILCPGPVMRRQAWRVWTQWELKWAQAGRELDWV